MKKLRLDIERLNVQSFEAGAETERRGTVRGHLPETHPQICPPSEDLYCSFGACTVYIQYCN
jgi:hypothetical protein